MSIPRQTITDTIYIYQQPSSIEVLTCLNSVVSQAIIHLARSQKHEWFRGIDLLANSLDAGCYP
eukprot:scaffold188331_cov21-Prasinocladus_malaysianus.AAC.1